MSDDKFNYYETQLNKLDIKSEYALQIVISDDTNKTKYFSINLESIPELRKFLDKVERELKIRNDQDKELFPISEDKE